LYERISTRQVANGRSIADIADSFVQEFVAEAPVLTSSQLASQNWTVAHEFGHLFGLDERDGEYDSSGSVMHSPASRGDPVRSPVSQTIE
jgi:hypothetical protein